MYIIGIDIGGTNLKIGLIKDEKIIVKCCMPTDKQDLVGQITNGVENLLRVNGIHYEDISHIGVGCPGIIINGLIVESPNLNLHNLDLSKILTQKFGINVKVFNDADMATMAEYKFGAGRGTRNMIMLTLGTGVGGGIIIDSKLYTGSGCAGELGHITFRSGGIKCNCGRLGCAEKYVSAVALSNRAKEIMQKMTNDIPIIEDMVYASTLMEYYFQNDPCAIEIIDEYLSDLTDYVLSLCNIFRPDKIVIGGGISMAAELIEMLDRQVKINNYGYPGAPSVKIVRAQLKNDGGILGACCIL